MNIAFSAILALILLLPGILASKVRRGSGKYAEIVPTPPQPFSIEIAAAFIWASLIHAVVATAAELLSRTPLATPRPNLEAAMMLLIGHYGKDESGLSKAVSSVADYPFSLLSYFIVACGLAIVLGWLLARPIEILCQYFHVMDGRDMIVDEWKRFFDLEESRGAMTTVVLEVGGVAYLYLAVLHKLHFNPVTAELERLELETVAKKRLETPTAPPIPEDTDDFEDIHGERFVVAMSEVKNMIVSYFTQESSTQA
jgi:hypothetical protein